ncbi:MAG: DUF4013 domain-containing protein [Methanomicrobiales archaeon]|nr:DUF4013 domain-containing protein [Methanomicrobiales archaeon]MDD1671120.1 DUF4013 domain-containing protein [Methanomicrobiales archaeon]
MDIGKTLNESFDYAKDAVWEKWVRWLLLIISSIIFPLILGYELEVYRGKKPAPELTDWVRLFIDGIKLFVIQIIYAIPTLIVLFLSIGAAVLAVTSPTQAMALWGSFAIGILITLIVAFITGLFAAMGAVRFARTGRMGEAFNFSAITDRIGKIGWGSYILALIVVYVVAGIIAFILSLIPFISWLLLLIVAPPLAIFMARYITLVYDSVPEAAAPPAA